MTDRALLAPERALIAAIVAFVAQPATGLHDATSERVLLLRIMTLCDQIAAMPVVDKFQIEHGPIQHLYWGAVSLIAVHRDKHAGHRDRKREARFMACHLLRYFETRSVLGLRALRLPDHVPAPPKTPVF